MKYIRGTQDYKVGEANAKRRFQFEDGSGESGWVYRHTNGDEVLLNNFLIFMPNNSWGAIIPKEIIDEKQIESLTEIVFHPDCFDEYVRHGVIDTDGNVITDNEFVGGLV